jgi:hypothetical protein
MLETRLKTRREFVMSQPQNEITAYIGYEIIDYIEVIYETLEKNKIENKYIDESLLHLYNKICDELIYDDFKHKDEKNM